MADKIDYEGAVFKGFLVIGALLILKYVLALSFSVSTSL